MNINSIMCLTKFQLTLNKIQKSVFKALKVNASLLTVSLGIQTETEKQLCVCLAVNSI